MNPSIFVVSLFLGLVCRASAAPDIRSVAPDLIVPPLSEGAPAPGRRVKQTLPGWRSDAVYHVLHLPTDWSPDKKRPLIVEYAGNGRYQNRYGDVSTGRPEDSRMGFGLAGGRDSIWVCLPYLNDAGTESVILWWGDAPDHDPRATVEYCKKAVPWICETYQGDPDRVILCGFSRGAIACNAIGLWDDDIATLWRAFIPYSHYDGVIERWPFRDADRASALTRLRRLAGRPQFICDEGETNLAATRDYLESTGVPGRFTFQATGFRNHNDAWLLRPSPARTALRAWLAAVNEDSDTGDEPRTSPSP